MRLFLPVLLILFVAACSKPEDEAAKSQEVSEAKEFQATQDIVQLRRDCQQYQALKGELPADWDALGRSKTDPWGTEYELYTEEGRIDIRSAGPDRKFDTRDDIRAPE